MSQPQLRPLPLGLNPFCATNGCKSPVKWQVGLMLTARVFKPKASVPVPFMTSLTVCDGCKGVPKPGHFLNADARKYLAAQVPAATIDFMSAKIVLKPFEGVSP